MGETLTQLTSWVIWQLGGCKTRWKLWVIMIELLLAPSNSVPAVAATQRGQVLFCLNGRKGCVGGKAGGWKNLSLTRGQNQVVPISLNCAGVGGILCLEYSSAGNTKVCRRWRCLAERNWRWDTKARGSNGIRYPSSPRCKLWLLSFGIKFQNSS